MQGPLLVDQKLMEDLEPLSHTPSSQPVSVLSVQNIS